MTLWAVAAPDTSQVVIGAIVTLVSAGIVTGFGYRQKRIGDQAQHELDGFKVSLESMVAALAQGNRDRDDLRAEVTATRNSLTAARAEIDQLRAAFEAERRDCDSRISSLRIQIRRLGGNPDESERS